jgi:hypothetical protein
MSKTVVVPDPEDFAEIDLADNSLSPAERYWHAQNLKLHRLAQKAGWHDEFPGENGNPL